jgi:hypothetical protein
VGPLGLDNRTIDRYMIYFSVVVSVLPLGACFGIGATSDCEDCAMGWESFILLWMWVWIGFNFCLSVVVLFGVGDLRRC